VADEAGSRRGERPAGTSGARAQRPRTTGQGRSAGQGRSTRTSRQPGTGGSRREDSGFQDGPRRGGRFGADAEDRPERGGQPVRGGPRAGAASSRGRGDRDSSPRASRPRRPGDGPGSRDRAWESGDRNRAGSGRGTGDEAGGRGGRFAGPERTEGRGRAGRPPGTGGPGRWAGGGRQSDTSSPRGTDRSGTGRPDSGRSAGPARSAAASRPRRGTGATRYGSGARRSPGTRDTGDTRDTRERSGAGEDRQAGSSRGRLTSSGGSDRSGRPTSSGRSGASDRPSSSGRPAGFGRSATSGRPGGSGGPERPRGRGTASPRQSVRDGYQGRREDRAFQRGDEADSRPRRQLPELPAGLDEQTIVPEVRAALRGVREETAGTVAKYLLAAETADDPEQAYEYAQAARSLAARIGLVREVAGIAAYRAGKWSEALAELRAARRLTGRNDYLPIMADSERALGRLDRALALIRDEDARELDRGAQIELRIVESGIRRDQGRPEAAVLALRVPELTDGRLRPWSARLFYAYGEALLAAGDQVAAREAFADAVEADPEDETGAAERLDEMDGITIDDLDLHET
jgi:predicted negative regulator of RcsB-dependent stress response